jgi:DNA methylase
MSGAATLLNDLRALGATLEPAGAQLLLRAGANPIPAALVRQVREAKSDLLAILTAAPNIEAAETKSGEAQVVDWLDHHPVPSPPGTCAWCRKPEGPGASVVPFGALPGTHTWLHAECWHQWHEHRRAEAARAIRPRPGLGMTPPAKQSRTMSLVEAVANVVVGFLLAVLTQLAVFPILGLQVSIGDNLVLGGTFTAVSIYDPEWRTAAGLKHNKQRTGKVANDDRADWREAWALFPGSVAYVWHAGRHTSTVQDSLTAVGFDCRAQIIWAKDRFALSRGHYHWQHEPCWYAVRKGASNWTGDRKQSTLWQIPAREGPGFEHGTQKPVACMQRPIENNSSPGQAVYEPFSGSGATIIAAEITGRVCYAIELLGQYVDVAVERWQAFTGAEAKLEADGRSFAAVAAERKAGKAA